jgi:hypothetical protein
MDKLERLAYWKSVAVDALRAAGREGVAEFEKIVFKDEDSLFGYFDCFRPDGKGVKRVFAGVVGGDEIVERLLRVYECTKESSNAWGYFIVRRPVPATPERLIDLTRQHLDKVRQIAGSFGHTRLTSELEPLPEIRIKWEAISQQTESDVYAPEASIYDVTGDWFRGLEPMESDALMMGEAFYSIACDYMIAHHLMWPLYRQSTEIEEPFAPYFDLWRVGALPFFERPGLVNVYVSEGDA